MKNFVKVFFIIIRILVTLFLLFALFAVIAETKYDNRYLLTGIVCYNVIWWTSNAFVRNLSRIGKEKDSYNPKQKVAYEDYMNSEERAFLYKIPNGAKIALAAVWLFIAIMLLSVLIGLYARPGLPVLNAGLFFPAGWCAITIAATSVMKNIDRKKDKSLVALYDKKYISTLEISDDFLGDMRFTYDSHLGSLESTSLNLPSFGKAPPSSLSIYGYSNVEKDNIFGRLKAVYAHADEILKDACEYACDICDDIYGLEEKLNPEPIRENAAVTYIDVNSKYITLYINSDNGKENDFSAFNITACIDLQNKTIDYELED